MEINLIRSLNGVVKTKDEMKKNIYKSDVLSKIIRDVNTRLNRGNEKPPLINKFSTNDKI